MGNGPEIEGKFTFIKPVVPHKESYSYLTHLGSKITSDYSGGMRYLLTLSNQFRAICLCGHG